MSMIGGVYASAPYIAGPKVYGDDEVFDSLKKNKGIFLPDMTKDAKTYQDDTLPNSMLTPTAWPLCVDDKYLTTDVPPHYIAVNEFDPLADEGEKYYEKLLNASKFGDDGNIDAAAISRHSLNFIKGTFHTSDFMMELDPEEAMNTFNNISSFCFKCKEIAHPSSSTI